MIELGGEHRLGLAVRIEDHFSLVPIEELLDVRVDTGEPPVRARTGGTRHDDGTYRWADLVDGPRRLTVRSGTGAWLRWDPLPIPVDVPPVDPQIALRIEMWPSASATPPPGVPAIRGTLAGAGVIGERVEIDGTGTTTPTGRWTRADAAGDFLFPLPGGPWPMTPAGALDLTIVVPGRTVTSIDVLPDLAAFGGPQFHLSPDRISRVRFHVT